MHELVNNNNNNDNDNTNNNTVVTSVCVSHRGNFFEEWGEPEIRTLGYINIIEKKLTFFVAKVKQRLMG